MEIGAQLYTVRNQCQNLEDFAESLKKVADMGYRTVQVSGTCPYPASWLKEQLDHNGLRCVLTHIPVSRLTDALDQVIADHTVFDCPYIGLGYWAFDPERGMSYDRWMELFPPIARKIASAGKLFMYHNHDQEFQKQEGRRILEHLAGALPPQQMGFTLDTFWVQVAGGDPAEWLEKLSGRVPVIHLKDYACGRKMAVVGEGNINFARVFEKAEAAGTAYMLVEQDDCNGEDPFECLRRSYENLHAWGFQ